MKTVLVILCAVVGALQKGEVEDTVETAPLPYNAAQNLLLVEEQKLHHIHDACQADPATNADHELLHDLSANLDNPQIGAHMLCESKGVGLQNERGELDKEVIRSKISLTIDDLARVNNLVNECAIPKNTPEKTAIHLFMCLDHK
ncbi:hypothetical protein NQ317_005142 [Molorchus minor]|uniref:Uncharacterized protein n=1 Tax=Molorchus minor TaxID=1323400 RepID=A0ABQ9JLE7_9CUCU|nr:hypothetical protein NQ317_005142 [Molorchus minor]